MRKLILTFISSNNDFVSLLNEIYSKKENLISIGNFCFSIKDNDFTREKISKFIKISDSYSKIKESLSFRKNKFSLKEKEIFGFGNDKIFSEMDFDFKKALFLKISGERLPEVGEIIFDEVEEKFSVVLDISNESEKVLLFIFDLLDISILKEAKPIFSECCIETMTHRYKQLTIAKWFIKEIENFYLFFLF